MSGFPKLLMTLFLATLLTSCGSVFPDKHDDHDDSEAPGSDLDARSFVPRLEEIGDSVLVVWWTRDEAVRMSVGKPTELGRGQGRIPRRHRERPYRGGFMREGSFLSNCLHGR